ncbi:cytochrome c3 family protein [Chloroflexota bacterium]
MKAIKKTSGLVLAILLVAALAQSIFNYAAASVDSLQPFPVAVTDGEYIFSDSPPRGDLAPLAPATEYVYGTAQSCSFTITDPDNSIDLAFNDTTASAQGAWSENTTNNWTFTAIQDATLTPTSVTAEYRFYVDAGWSDDSFTVEVYDGTSWSTLEIFSNSNSPPTTLTTKSYNVWAVLDTQAKINAAQMRFRGVGMTGGADTFTIYVDEVRLIATASLTQAHYRIGNDKPLSAMTWKGGVDQEAISIRRNTNYRMRFQVYNDGILEETWQPQLDWSSTNGTGYAIVPTASGGTPFFVTDTTQFTNGDTISTADFGCGAGTGTSANGTAYDTENPPASVISLNNGYYTEIEFNIQANSNASYNGTYYFRLTDNGTALDAYDVTEAVITIQLQPSPSDPHNTYSSVTDKCAACHRLHTSIGPSMRNAWYEEDMCFTCHNSTGASIDLQTIFTKQYKHDVAGQSGVHLFGESGSVAFANRHVECEDCHNPHNSIPGGATAPSAQGPIEGASGVEVDNGGSPGAPTYTFERPVSYEYEVCFKCHSSYTANYTGTDKGADFNTNNPSYHPVEGTGQNLGIMWEAFTDGSGWETHDYDTTSNRTYCSDCHGSDNGSDPAGPHASNNQYILKDSGDALCYNCHKYEVYHDGDPGSRLTGGIRGRATHVFHVGTEALSCDSCHDVHGRTDSYHLMNLVTYTHTGTGGSCDPTCHTGAARSYTLAYP